MRCNLVSKSPEIRDYIKHDVALCQAKDCKSLAVYRGKYCGWHWSLLYCSVCGKDVCECTYDLHL